MKTLKTFGETKDRADAAIQQLEQRGAVNTARVDTTVRTILADIRQGGDSALREYATRFDELADKPLRVTAEEMRDAWEPPPAAEELKAAPSASPRPTYASSPSANCPKPGAFVPWTAWRSARSSALSVQSVATSPAAATRWPLDAADDASQPRQASRGGV